MIESILRSTRCSLLGGMGLGLAGLLTPRTAVARAQPPGTNITTAQHWSCRQVTMPMFTPRCPFLQGRPIISA